MLTPSFHLQQNDEFILLQINASYIKANDVEIYIDGHEFKFYVKPYFLRLRFQKQLMEDGRETASYDISKGVFDIKIPKKNKGEHFPDLSMLTNLLAVKKNHNMKPLIEDVTKQGRESSDEEEPEEGEFCWEWEQTAFQPSGICLEHKYGFANQTTGVFKRLQDEFYEVVDLPDPDKTPIKDRRIMRVNAEMQKFDEDHYIADYFDDEMIQKLIRFAVPWEKECERILKEYKEKTYPETSGLIEAKSDTLLYCEKTNIELTEEEKYTLLKLPNKSYILSKEEEYSTWLSLVDILFAYCYNYRTTEGESTSESAWTICKLSSTFSWLGSFTSLHDVIYSGYCRCLCYPLYRHWSLINRVFKDLRLLFSLGKCWILRCLLDTRKILLASENRYILNDLYITDYIVWIQKQKPFKILSLSNRLNIEHILKTEIPFNIKSIELDDMQNVDGKSLSDSEDDCSSENEGYVESSTDSDDQETAGNHETKAGNIHHSKIEVVSSCNL